MDFCDAVRPSEVADLLIQRADLLRCCKFTGIHIVHRVIHRIIHKRWDFCCT